jgi:CheY-like chemotaxis protein
VLVAEDNSVNQLLATRLLEKFGHTVEVAENGQIAIEKWQAGDYDLILMDVDMPLMNGHAATRRIRELEKDRDQHIPVIGLTAHVMQGSREACLASGMDGYLSKPINTEALWVELESIRSGSATPQEESPAVQAAQTIDDSFIVEKALVLMDNDMALLVEMARIFLADYSEYLEQLGEAINQRDEILVTRLAHTIKGMLSVFCIPSLADIAARIEMQKGVDHRTSYATLRQGLESLAVELRKVCDAKN